MLDSVKWSACYNELISENTLKLNLENINLVI
jgi:hypothetical protein